MKIKKIKYFAKGKRSIAYIGYYKNKKVIVKRSLKINTLKNEANFLKILNKYKIGPKLISYNDNKIIYEFVDGKRIIEWIKDNNKQKIKRILLDILKKCRILDELKINKKELTNPYKHILIDKKAVMIDFERCRFNKKPKNITQFCQFLISKRLYNIIKEKDFNINEYKLRKLLIKYKHSYSKGIFYDILRLID